MMITYLGCIYFAFGYAEWKKVGKEFQKAIGIKPGSGEILSHFFSLELL